MKSLLTNVGRVFLALYFLIPGLSKFTSWDTNVSLMEAHNMRMIPVLLAIAGIAQVAGGISLLLNKHVVVCSLGLAVMTLLINFNLHDFWNIYEGVSADRELQNFYKNLGIFAGLLLLAAVNLEEPQNQSKKNMSLRPFHLAIPVSSISQAKDFYGSKLGFSEGRSDKHWVDYNFFGHQLVCHIGESTSFINEVDGKEVPVPHFGILLEWEEFDNFEKKLKENDINFIIEPYLRFEGLPGEQKTMFFKDPFGNALEFKSFKDDAQIFRKKI